MQTNNKQSNQNPSNGGRAENVSLNNCRSLNWPSHLPEQAFKFTGKSMINYSDYESARLSISDNSEKGGTILFCEKISCLEDVNEGNLQFEITDVFVAICLTGRKTLVNIRSVSKVYFVFSFQNPDKSLFPDQIVKISDIKSLYQVNRVSYDQTLKNSCQCETHGDYCGKYCKNTN